MLSIKLPTDVERHLEEVVQKSYNGDLQVAITSFLRLDGKNDYCRTSNQSDRKCDDGEGFPREQSTRR